MVYHHIGKGCFSMRKGEAQGANAAQMVTAVALGGLLALGVELMVLLLGSAAVSNEIGRASCRERVYVLV